MFIAVCSQLFLLNVSVENSSVSDYVFLVFQRYQRVVQTNEFFLLFLLVEVLKKLAVVYANLHYPLFVHV